MDWTRIAVFAACLLIGWFVLLRPDLNPTSPDDKRNWFQRAYGSVTTAWASHGSVWKRWACFVAGAGACVLVQWALHLIA